MTSASVVIAVVSAYVGLLCLVAIWVERQERRGRRVAGNAFAYTLSMAAYATTWTYYGNVGFAASTGFSFLGVYLGPTLLALFWWQVLRKMVRIKNTHRVTSLVDLLSLRYRRSQSVAMLGTVALLLVLIPYISMQLKTMIATVSLLAGYDPSRAYPAIGRDVGPPLVLLMILSTIVIGIRRLKPTERHPGMVVVLAAEGVLKLVGILAAGAFVTYGLFRGFGDVFHRAGRAGLLPGLLGRDGSLTTILSMAAESMLGFLLLPHMFQVAVVENSDERHIRTAMWAFPSYMLAITLFVLPIALGGLLLGYPASSADSFVLSLPYGARARGLSWLVFLGGFSSGGGMVVVETMTLATMVSNHLLLPATALWRPLARLRRHLLVARWCAAATIIITAFAYERAFGSQYRLVSIGIVSYTAMLMFAPAILGGLYWRGASTAGSVTGLCAGFATWAYTMIVPEFIRAGWLPRRLLTDGPAGLSALRPEALFGLSWLHPIPHAVFWILVSSLLAFVFGSLLFPEATEEVARAERIIQVLEPQRPRHAQVPQRALAEAAEKRARVVRLFSQYFGEPAAERIADSCLAKVRAGASDWLSPLQLATLEAEVETTLAASVGAAEAHAAVQRLVLVTATEARAISSAYARILAALKVPPTELRRRIDYYRERERLLAREAAAQRFLAGVSGRLAGSLDMETTGRAIVHLAVPRLADSALLWLLHTEAPRLWFAHADSSRERSAIAALTSSLPLVPHACLSRAMESRRPVIHSSEAPDGWPAGLFEAAPFSGHATFPLLAGGQVLGTLTLFLSDRSRFRVSDDLALGEELAYRSALAVENAALFRKAENAVRARDEFLAVASHELKTPLTPLQLNLQSLQRLAAGRRLSKLPEEQLEEILRRIVRQVRRLAGLVDELLDASLITVRRPRLNLESMDLGATVRDVIDRHQSELAQAGCTLSAAIATGVVGRWDRFRTEQVVTNLLTNAMKYAPGPIEVSVAAEGEIARLTIRDRGPGIADADQRRIFLPFERAASYLRTSGFGLGLYVVRQIADAHGGDVRLQSVPGQGSTFIVELPRNLPAERSAARPGACPGS
jgi:signal transduction histidine kinase/Na+/proline symporter